MSGGTKFLSVVDAFQGYCQICYGPQVVGEIAVAGWPFHGAVCARCLGDLADEVGRRAKALNATPAGAGLEGLIFSGTAAAAAGPRGNGRLTAAGAFGTTQDR